tara:strand:- start:3344 stop:3649 length:306 start_codon:yes stop_codon:yes gene_type:complete
MDKIGKTFAFSFIDMVATKKGLYAALFDPLKPSEWMTFAQIAMESENLIHGSPDELKFFNGSKIINLSDDNEEKAKGLKFDAIFIKERIGFQKDKSGALDG